MRSTTRWLRVVLSCGALTAPLAVARGARAEEPRVPVLSWWIEGRPWTCSDPVGTVARHVALACDASGGRCRVASSRGEADRIAALGCSSRSEPWRLEAEDRSGAVMWTVSLTGDEEARARKAALWIARAESDGPLDDAPAPAASPSPAPATSPAPSPASVPSPAPVAPPEPPATTAVAPPIVSARAPAPAAAEEAPTPGSIDASRVRMTASLQTGIPESALGSLRDSMPMAGTRFSAAVRLDGDLFVGGALDGITAPQPDADHSTYSHLGGLVALGAPYAHDWVGASFEGGVSVGKHPSGSLYEGGPFVSDGFTASPYAKGTVTVQWPRETGIRPHLALSYLVSRDGMNQTLLADLGVTWGAW